MLFNSYVFLFCLLPATLILYFLLGKTRSRLWQQLVLIAASLVFYGYFNPWYLFIICGSILGNFAFSKLLLTERVEKKWKKPLLVLAILANLGLLFYYKYYDFFIENVNALFSTGFSLRHVVLPLGISFFTFQQLSYVVDSYRGETGAYSFLDYAVFVTFFPQLVAGPIVLHGQMIPQFQDSANRRPNYENLFRGLYVFAIGLFKKVLIADTFGKAVTWGFSDVVSMSAPDVWIVMFSYTFQIYFDFSGYCDMASGIASMFNIELPVNFNSPYKALSIVDFWNRWHISLTSFLREYLYFPLGGSRKGKVRTYLNILIVFLASGVWHGANWTFILWGALHGVMNVLTRVFQKTWNKMHVAFQWLMTFLFVSFTWLLFRSETTGFAVLALKKMFLDENTTLSAELTKSFVVPELSTFRYLLPITPLGELINGFDMWLFLVLALFAVLNLKNCNESSIKPSLSRAVLTAALLAWSVLSLTGVTTFLYYNF